jgi:hypothetical protein
MNTSQYIAIILFIACSKMCLSQTVVEKNLQYLDSVESTMRTFMCNGILEYPDKHTMKKLSDDLAVIKVLNNILDADFNEAKLAEIKSVKKVRIINDEKKNGLIKINKLIIIGNYLRAELTIEGIDDYVFRKKCLLTTTTAGRCDPSGWKVLDFKLLKEKVIKEMNFPVKIFDNRYVKADDFSAQNIQMVSHSYPDYKFNTPEPGSKDWIDKVFYKQYNSDSTGYYSYVQAPKDFVALIQNDRLDIIKSLLFSPNYFYAVNATEALIYLSSVNKVVLDDALKLKMTSVKQQKMAITVQRTYDSFATYKDYETMGLTEGRIVAKYQNTLKQLSTDASMQSR